MWWQLVIGCTAFLGITGILLVMDLDRPERFLYVMLRPNWDSWVLLFRKSLEAPECLI